MDNDVRLYYYVAQASRVINQDSGSIDLWVMVATIITSDSKESIKLDVLKRFVCDIAAQNNGGMGGYTINQIDVVCIDDQTIDKYVSLRYGIDLSEVRNGA